MEARDLKHMSNLTAIALFLISLLFDSTVTFSFFKCDPGYFFEHEANPEVRDFLKYGRFPLRFTIANLFPIILLFVTTAITNRIPKLNFLWVIALLILLTFASHHIIGGLSWLIF